MSTSGNKSDWVILGWLGAFSVLVLLGLAFFMQEDDWGPGDWLRSSRSINREGTQLFFKLLESFDYPIRASSLPLQDETLEGVSVVFLIDPVVPILREEHEALRSWLFGGGTLVTTEAIEELHPYFEQIEYGWPEDEQPSEPNEIDFTSFEKLKLSATEAKEGKLTKEVAKVCFRSHCYIEKQANKPLYRILFADEVGQRIVEMRAGQGKIILISDSFFLCNRGILLADNSILAMNTAFHAAAPGQEHSILYDEYHYSFAGRGESGLGLMSHLLMTTPAGWSVLCLLGAGAVFLFRASSRFGIARDTHQRRRRSKMEFIDSLGQTFRRAGAHKLVFDILYRDFREKLLLRSGLSAGAPNASLVDEICRGRSSEARADELAKFLDQCDALAGKDHITEHEFQRGVGALTKLEKEVLS